MHTQKRLNTKIEAGEEVMELLKQRKIKMFPAASIFKWH